MRKLCLRDPRGDIVIKEEPSKRQKENIKTKNVLKRTKEEPSKRQKENIKTERFR